MLVRDTHIDNIKGLLMLLVVFGHLVYPVPNPDAATDAAYVFVYGFHMPMFALVSGYLSHANWSWTGQWGGVKQLLIPYAMFACLQWVLLKAAGQQPYPLYEGQFGLWFLLSLFCWRALLPLVVRLPAPMAICVALSLLSGFVSEVGMEFSLARTINFLPFFLAGHLMRTRGVSPARTMKRSVALVVVMVSVVAAVMLSEGNVHNTLFGAFSYQAIGVPPGIGPAVRLAQFLLACASGLAVLTLVPKQNGLLSRFGQNSLYVYLLHSPLLVLYRAWPANYDILGSQPLLMIPVAVGVCWVLSSEIMMTMTRRLVAPFAK